MIRLTSLKQKIALLVILPLCLTMLIAGSLGMRLISDALLKQWEETAISKGELFGKERTKDLIVQYAHLSAREITNNTFETIEIFRGTQPENDDITLAIIKTQTNRLSTPTLSN